MDEQPLVARGYLHLVLGVLDLPHAQHVLHEVGEGTGGPFLQPGRRVDPFGRRRQRRPDQVAVEAGETVAAAIGHQLGASTQSGISRGRKDREREPGRTVHHERAQPVLLLRGRERHVPDPGIERRHVAHPVLLGAEKLAGPPPLPGQGTGDLQDPA